MRLPVRLRIALFAAGVVLASGGALLLAAYAVMVRQLDRSLSPALADTAADDLRGQFLLVLAGAVLGAGVLGWLAAGRALRPLRRVADAARATSGEALEARVALDGPRDELREVADTFDGMLERLNDAFAAQRRFVGHAGHELRRPLTAMRTELDVTLADPDADVAELRRMAAELSAAVDRCEELVESLLTLARGAGVAVGDELADLGRACQVALAEIGPEARIRRLALESTLKPAPVRGDRRLLERLVANLVENAVRHNVPDGLVIVASGTEADRAVVRVESTGPEIAPERLTQLLEPFVRGEATRAQGSGLGLAIVRTIARAHGGTIELTPRPGGGLIAEVALPLRSSAPRPPADEPARAPSRPRSGGRRRAAG